jgi:hypothetical protein
MLEPEGNPKQIYKLKYLRFVWEICSVLTACLSSVQSVQLENKFDIVRTGFNPKPVHFGKVAEGQVLFQATDFYVTLALSFHQWSVRINS